MNQEIKLIIIEYLAGRLEDKELVTKLGAFKVEANTVSNRIVDAAITAAAPDLSLITNHQGASSIQDIERNIDNLMRTLTGIQQDNLARNARITRIEDQLILLDAELSNSDISTRRRPEKQPARDSSDGRIIEIENRLQALDNLEKSRQARAQTVTAQIMAAMKHAMEGVW